MSSQKLNHLEEKEAPISGIRKAIAKNLKEVLETSAYCSLVLKADVTNLWNLRAKVKDKVFEEHNIKLTFLSWIVKASAIALSEYPSFVLLDEMVLKVKYTTLEHLTLL